MCAATCVSAPSGASCCDRQKKRTLASSGGDGGGGARRSLRCPLVAIGLLFRGSLRRLLDAWRTEKGTQRQNGACRARSAARYALGSGGEDAQVASEVPIDECGHHLSKMTGRRDHGG
jgi:hypothetical protein